MFISKSQLATSAAVFLFAACGYPELPLLPVTGDAQEPDARPPLKEPQSCKDQSLVCGRNQEDCCTSLLVEGGTFRRGNLTNFSATISSFRLDQFEVTAGRFGAFLTAGKWSRSEAPLHGEGTHPNLLGSGWNEAWNVYLPPPGTIFPQCDDLFAILPNPHTQPINCVTWYEAMAFCIWDGGYLPTSTELNYAATGGSQQNEYPWGSTFADPTVASYECLADGMQFCSRDDIVPVGSLWDLSRWGHSDLGGNVAEWTLDWHGELPVPCVDCAQLNEPFPLRRIARGGSFMDDETFMRTSFEKWEPPDIRSSKVGFRCARPAP
jgi:formylglycine-generating enzyme